MRLSLKHFSSSPNQSPGMSICPRPKRTTQKQKHERNHSLSGICMSDKKKKNDLHRGLDDENERFYHLGSEAAMSGTPTKELETNTVFLTSRRLRGHRWAKMWRSFAQPAAERAHAARRVEAEHGPSAAVGGSRPPAPAAWRSSASGFEATRAGRSWSR